MRIIWWRLISFRPRSVRESKGTYLHVLVPHYSELVREDFTVDAEETTVQRERGEEFSGGGGRTTGRAGSGADLGGEAAEGRAKRHLKWEVK
jgi:hypothetical protein